MKNMENLTSSIRSDQIESFKPSSSNTLSPQSSMKKLDNVANLNAQSYKQSSIPQNSNNYPQVLEKNKELQLNMYASMPATQSFIHPSSTKNLKNMKLNLPINQGSGTMGLSPSGSAKNIAETNPSYFTSPQATIFCQNSEKKLKIPLEPNRK